MWRLHILLQRPSGASLLFTITQIVREKKRKEKEIFASGISTYRGDDNDRRGFPSSPPAPPQEMPKQHPPRRSACVCVRVVGVGGYQKKQQEKLDQKGAGKKRPRKCEKHLAVQCCCWTACTAGVLAAPQSARHRGSSNDDDRAVGGLQW